MKIQEPMLKLDIVSENRIGITQEILAVFGNHGWDLVATEMHPHHTYVAADVQSDLVPTLTNQLKSIKGVSSVNLISLLPNEVKQQHLNALLSSLPDPVLDIDNRGEILVANQAARLALGIAEHPSEEVFIHNILEISLSKLLAPSGCSMEIDTNGNAYLLEATPVNTKDTINGAVIVLRSSQRMGKQLSVIRSNLLMGTEAILGNSAKIKSVKHQCSKFANLNLPVLILGETGTGKELFAQSLHHESDRSNEPFLAINCASLSENLLESELFGYAPGAFSGAGKSGKPGLFELANKGTVFLDEIGEMSTYLQAKLLRFLQDFRFRRIGGTREISVDVRVVCATHRELTHMIKTGEFREDLLYRLNVLNLNLPPLRERQEDIEPLVSHFLKQACEQASIPMKSLTPELMSQIKQHLWPGNVRQLQNTLFRAAVLSDTGVISNIDDLTEPQYSIDLLEADVTTKTDSSFDKITSLSQEMERHEKDILSALYNHYPSSRKLAERLSVSHANIARKLSKYGIGQL